jgi:predicted DNA-binding protein
MEPTAFALTPEQKSLLEALARETGKPVSSLIAQALEGL